MQSPCAAAVLVVLTLAPSLASQSSRTSLRPDADFLFEERADGSIVTADTYGTYFFADWPSYFRSSFFQEHGLHCGTDRLPLPLALGTSSDCNSSHTSIETQYNPSSGPDYVVPVVFHILRRTNGTANVSDALIDTQIDVLNEDFGAFGAGAPGANTRIQFVLAGVTRHSNDTWYNDGGSYYNTIAWDPTQYLNIYTNNASGNLGYATVPSGGGVVGNLFDRVVILWNTVGRPGPYGSPYDLGRTVTHEVGHYLGLYHTFQGGCASAANCANNGDLICDTNPESSPNFSPCTRSSCGSPDPTHNYMDYSDDVCMDNFTANQANRMRCTLENFRPDLVDNPLPAPASGPSPIQNAVNVSVNADLSWSTGAGATSHDVYLGTNSSPGAGEFQGNQAGTSYDPGTLLPSTTYYWRIDEVNAAGTTTGNVWKFTTEPPAAPPGVASAPHPGNGATGIGRNTDLTWTGGFGAASHDVYFGTTNPPPFVGNQASTTFDPGSMARFQTYYWRVDEVNAQGTTTGAVWSFTTLRKHSDK